MDRDQVHRGTRRLAAGTSRRGAVGSVLARVTTLLIDGDTLTAKPGGSGKSNGHGPEKLPGYAKAKNTAKAKGKVWLCHKPAPITDPVSGLVLDATKRRGTVIQVAASAKGGPNRRNTLLGHLGHRDGVCPELPGALYLKDTACEVAVGVTGEVTSRWCTTPPTPPLT